MRIREFVAGAASLAAMTAAAGCAVTNHDYIGTLVVDESNGVQAPSPSDLAKGGKGCLFWSDATRKVIHVKLKSGDLMKHTKSLDGLANVGWSWYGVDMFSQAPTDLNPPVNEGVC